MSLPGDNDLEAILMEMGATSNPIKNDIDTLHSRVQPHESLPSMKLLSFVEWMQQLPSSNIDSNLKLKLTQSFDETCTKYKRRPSTVTTNAHDTCHRCGLSESEHGLKFRDSPSQSISTHPHTTRYRWCPLFAAVRNLRCAITSEHRSLSESMISQYQQHLSDAWKDHPINTKNKNQYAIERQSLLDAGILELLTATSSPTLSAHSRKHEHDNQLYTLALACDKVYYRIYYGWLTTTPSRSDHEMWDHVPPLHVYLPHVLSQYSRDDGRRRFESFLQRLTPTVRSQVEEWWGIPTQANTTNAEENPLYLIWQCRWNEMLARFEPHFLQEELRDANSRPEHLQPEFRIHETLCRPLLAAWRDVARDFPASTYSYATPSPFCLQKLQELLVPGKRRVVEVGAGTGYWARLLQDMGVHVTAYDKDPPAVSHGNVTGSSYNEYHGNMRAYTLVHQGDVDDTAGFDVLFLCYPPPGTDMALRALTGFAGSTVIHVGEWAGLTGNARFESYLWDHFGCTESILLPSWGTDATYMTLWVRGASSSGRPVGAGGCIACQERLATRRCRFARILQYCSNRACFETHRQDRKSYLLLQMLGLGDAEDVDMNEDRHFHSLETRPAPHRKRRRIRRG